MTIDEFKEHASKELEKFVEMYKKNNKKKPEEWPVDLSEAEWWSQWMADQGFMV